MIETRAGARLRGAAALAWLCAATSIACAPVLPPAATPEPHRVVDVGFAKPDPDSDSEARPTYARAVLVIAPELEQFVYVHHDSRWRRTFHIHLGTYVRDRMIELTERRFRWTRVAQSLHGVPPLPNEVTFILIPELGQIDYSTPHLAAEDDARFEVRLRVRILYSTRREAGTLYASGSAEGPFGVGGANTPDLVRGALDEMISEIDRVLAATVPEL